MKIKFIGATGTRGQAILAGKESIKIHGEYVPINAKVAIEILNGHLKLK